MSPFAKMTQCSVEPGARENLAMLRLIAPNRLKDDPTKLGIQNKRLEASWEERYLAKLLFEETDPPSKRKPSEASNISSVDTSAMSPFASFQL
jgi:hypothetical protein